MRSLQKVFLVIHRDLKPTNIVIKRRFNKFIKVADFGLATFHLYENQTHTQGIGSIKYSPPEVIGGAIYDTKADIYSLGVTIQELFNININA